MKNKNLKTYLVENDGTKPTVIMLHGYGANGRDLAGLAGYPEISTLNYNWVFIEAPLSPPELAAFGGYAWFNLTLSSFGPNMSVKTLEDFYGMTTDEFKSSLEKIESTIWDLNLKTDVYLGGFSQGAMMASNVFFASPNQYKALIALSGAPLNYQNWQNLTEPKRIFISHGEQDPVLPIKCGKDLKEKTLSSKGLVEEHWFQGGHEIPPSVLNQLAQFLKS